MFLRMCRWYARSCCPVPADRSRRSGTRKLQKGAEHHRRAGWACCDPHRLRDGWVSARAGPCHPARPSGEM